MKRPKSAEAAPDYETRLLTEEEPCGFINPEPQIPVEISAQPLSRPEMSGLGVEGFLGSGSRSSAAFLERANQGCLFAYHMGLPARF